MKLSVIIAAGGAGERMRAGGSKQLLQLAGKPVLAHTIGIFHPLEIVREIVVAIDSGDIERLRSEVIDAQGFRKVACIVGGGKSRAESVCNALEQVASDTDTVLVHDGARPLFPAELLGDGLSLLEDGSADGIVFGLPVTDTIKETDAAAIVASTLDRSRLWAAQTPQVFKRSILEEAYRLPQNELAAATDDASLVERVGGRVLMLEGSSENIKLTRPSDLLVAAEILARRETN